MLYGTKLEALEADLAKERMKATQFVDDHPPNEHGGPANVGLPIDTPKGQARDIAAKALGVSHTIISDAKVVENQAPELIPKVISGELPVHIAANIAREEDEGDTIYQ